MTGASDTVTTDTGEIVVPRDAYVTVDVDAIAIPDATKSSGQRLANALQHRFADHEIIGSDGLAEIVTVHMTRGEASDLESTLQPIVDRLRERYRSKGMYRVA
jgi:hypothetical protein